MKTEVSKTCRLLSTIIINTLIMYRSKFVSDDWMIEHGFMEPPPADHQWYVCMYVHAYKYACMHEFARTCSTHARAHTHLHNKIVINMIVINK